MIEYLRHLHETANEAGEPILVARLDQQPAPSAHKRRGTAELSVGIVLWPRFPLLSLSGLTDALRHAADTGDQSRPIRCEWKVLGTPGQRVASSGGLDVPIDSEMGDPQRFDYIVVIGGLLDSLADVPKSYPAFLHQAAAAGVPLIGLCTGSFVLAVDIAGNPDLLAYTLSSGTLTSTLSAATGNDPVGAIAIAAAP